MGSQIFRKICFLIFATIMLRLASLCDLFWDG